MSKNKTLATAPTMDKITAYINEYYYSKNYEVLMDGIIHNTKTDKILDDVKVIPYKNGYKFIKIEK